MTRIPMWRLPRWRGTRLVWVYVVFLLLVGWGTFSAGASSHSQEAAAGIRGYVWLDANHNGFLDPQETRLASVWVYLEDDAGNVISQTQTYANGLYQFSNLAGGRYVLHILVPAGLMSITGDRVICEVTAGQICVVNFGLAQGPSPSGITPTPTPSSPLPTPTPTPTATATPSPTSTPTPTPTPTLSIILVRCTDVIRNGDFRTQDGWDLPRTHIQGAIVDAQAFPLNEQGTPVATPHSTPFALRLGAIEPVDPPSYSSARQVVNIPANATSARITFYVWTFSQDTLGDRQEVYLLNPHTLRILHRLWRASPALNERKWVKISRDLLPYRGGQYVLYFNAYNDGDNKVTALFVDDVELQVCVPVEVTPTPTPSPTATLQESQGAARMAQASTPSSPTPSEGEKTQQAQKGQQTGEEQSWYSRIMRSLQNTVSGLQKFFGYLFFVAVVVLVVSLLFLEIIGEKPSPPDST